MDSRFVVKDTKFNRKKIICLSLLSIFICFVMLLIYANHTQKNGLESEAIHAEEDTSSLEFEEQRSTISVDGQQISSYQSRAARLEYSLEAVEMNDDTVTIRGWMINQDDLQANGNASLFVNGQYYLCESIPRTDLTEYFKNDSYINSGFSCKIDISGWEQSEYSITLCSINKENKIKYEILLPEKINLK